METRDQAIPSEPARAKDIVGFIILGKNDPKQMTPEEFDHSPDLLYHGSAKEINFSPDYDYGDQESYFADAVGDASTTLGFGFYTTPSRQSAENYSQVRQKFLPEASTTPCLISLLPYKAQVLDLRSRSDLNQNGFFPVDLALAWREYFQEYLDQRPLPSEGDNLAQIFYEGESDYKKYLTQVIEIGNINLRHLLQTDQFPSPRWSYLFTRFMLKQGIDGVVYNEGSEAVGSKVEPSYVFYNLKKIGTWQSWQNIPSSS